MFSYRYYDTPEGHDIWKKTIVMTKYAVMTGMPIATFDVLMYTKPQGILNTVGRYSYHLGPLIGMAVAFSATANISQNYRGKDDVYNYLLGAFASGSIYGAWQKSIYKGSIGVLLLSAAALVKKTSIEEGWLIFPPVKKMGENAVSAKHDWTLVKDLPKTWTTGASSDDENNETDHKCGCNCK